MRPASRRAFFFASHSLCRQFRDVGLLAKKAVAFHFRDNNVTNAGKPGDQSAQDVAPNLHDRNAEIGGRFFDLESTSIGEARFVRSIP
jgi:hypothetical protein